MKKLSVILAGFCLVFLVCLNLNHTRLEQASSILEPSDEAGQEGRVNELNLPSNDDATEPTHAITIVSENELADVTPRTDELLKKAEDYLKANSKKFSNHNYLTVVDFSLPSSKARMFVEDLRTGVVLSYHVAHGSGSDPGNTGTPTQFSNVIGSNASSVGFFRVAETYIGKHGLSARLDGLSDTNSNVRVRAVVIHGANYVYTADKKAGRSWGCFAVNQGQSSDVVTMLKGGSLLYAEGK